MAAQLCTVTGTILDNASAGWTGTVRLEAIGDLASLGGYSLPSSVVVTAGTFTSTVLISPCDIEWTFVNSNGTIADVQQKQIADGFATRTLTQIFGGAITLPAASLAATNLTAMGITATVAELNIMDGVTATAAEISKLAGAGAIVASGTQQVTVADLSIAAVTGVDGVGSNAASKADVDTAFTNIVTKMNAILASLEAFDIHAA